VTLSIEFLYVWNMYILYQNKTNKQYNVHGWCNLDLW
jgi:hypothetical protein